MNYSASVLAFCIQWAIPQCAPDDVAKMVIDHLGSPFDQITWCCGTWYEGGELPTHWELDKPHTRLCDKSVNGLDPSWKNFIGSIYMGHERTPDYKNYCAIWLHKAAPLVG